MNTNRLAPATSVNNLIERANERSVCAKIHRRKLANFKERSAMPISNPPNANACKVMKPQSNNDKRAPLVCIMVYDQLCAFEYGICLEVFGLPRP